MSSSQTRSAEERTKRPRVPAASIACALDEIIERRQLEHPYALYRQIAGDTGVHPTTVLRYHAGRMTTARSIVRSRTLALLQEVRRGNRLPFEGRPARARQGVKRPPQDRVPSDEVQEVFEDIRQALGVKQYQFIYRYLAERLDVHATTIMRYLNGDLRTAPTRLLDDLNVLRDRVTGDDAVPFTRNIDGTPIVLREKTVELLRRLLGEGDHDSRAAAFRKVEARLGLRSGTLARIYYDRKLELVRADIHEALEWYVDGADYDASALYRVGDRICHHLLGLGTVKEKIHKDKILVEFVDGRLVLLSEAVPEDPYAYVRAKDSIDMRPHQSMWDSAW